MKDITVTNLYRVISAFRPQVKLNETSVYILDDSARRMRNAHFRIGTHFVKVFQHHVNHDFNMSVEELTKNNDIVCVINMPTNTCHLLNVSDIQNAVNNHTLEIKRQRINNGSFVNITFDWINNNEI